MKKGLVLSLVGMFVATSCSNVSKIDDLSGVAVWNKDTVYGVGSYVQQGGNVYSAAYRSKGAQPSETVASGAFPQGAWRRASVAEFEKSAKATAPTLSDIGAWANGTVYNASSLVRGADGSYYQAMWWNQNQDPTKDENRNNFVGADGATNWGPWVLVSAEKALEILQSQVDNGNTGNGNTGSGEEGGSTGGNTGSGNTGNDIVGGEYTGTVTADEIARFEWKNNLVYTENMLATIDGKFYRTKWWNKDQTPTTPYEFAWDSPWEHVTEGYFRYLIDNGGITPPPTPPTTGGGTTGGGNEVVDSLTPAYAAAVKQGYIKSWKWDELPADLQKAFNDHALVKGDIFAVQDGSQALALFESKINAEKWNQLFPRRRGSAGWYKENPGVTGVEDFFSYDNFKAAMLKIGEYAYLIQNATEPTTGAILPHFERTYVLHKPSREVRLVSQSSDYFAGEKWLLDRPHVSRVVDYAAFGEEGSENDKKRVIAGFLAHASHETSGSWATAPSYAFDKSLFPGANFPAFITDQLPGELAWSLYFNEEVAFANASSSPYTQAENRMFPPTPGQSYHGRGPFQLSWNYNYGLMSAIYFGDSNVLLDNPKLVTDGGTIPSNPDGNTWGVGDHYNGGTLAFMTSLSFWLTPQGAKPSQQDTMILNRTDGKYVAGTAKLVEDAGRGVPGYGWTINIMNGGYEAGKSWVEGHDKYDAKVARRVKHYTFFTQAMGGNNDGEVLDTYGKHQY